MPDGRILASYLPAFPRIWSRTSFSFSRKFILTLVLLNNTPDLNKNTRTHQNILLLTRPRGWHRVARAGNKASSSMKTNVSFDYKCLTTFPVDGWPNSNVPSTKCRRTWWVTRKREGILPSGSTDATLTVRRRAARSKQARRGCYIDR